MNAGITYAFQTSISSICRSNTDHPGVLLQHHEAAPLLGLALGRIDSLCVCLKKHVIAFSVDRDSSVSPDRV